MSKYRRRECRSIRLFKVWNANSSSVPVHVQECLVSSLKMHAYWCWPVISPSMQGRPVSTLLSRFKTTRLYIVAMLDGSSPAPHMKRLTFPVFMPFKKESAKPHYLLSMQSSGACAYAI